MRREQAVRFLLRLIGYLSVAAGFVALVIDGARSIANAGLRFTPVSEVLIAVIQERYQLIQPAIERNLHPWLWDPLLLSLMRAPAAAAALLLGFALLWLGRRPDEVIGIVTRR
ncbi:hypothetical protein [Bosea sp. UC22_33]|uniref:hypothetical protein n=1 Tax=Bosea sp. UC22_33 TaxID=3350165 RepID=UPI003672095A